MKTSDAEAYQISFDDVERGEIGRARHALVREPATQPARLLMRLYAKRARQRQCDQGYGRASRQERRLQRRLFPQIEREKKTDLHKTDRLFKELTPDI